jgi:hypothetical protein
MRSTIEPRDVLKVKSLVLTLFLTALMSESAEAQFIPTITVPRPTITVPGITVPRPTITVPRPTITVPGITVPRPTITAPTITVPRPTITAPGINVPAIQIDQPTVAVPQITRTELSSSFEINVPEGSIRPSFVSAIQEEDQTPVITTGVGSINIAIPDGVTTTMVNVVRPSQNIVDPQTVNLNVNLTPIPDVGFLVNSVNFSFPVLD